MDIAFKGPTGLFETRTNRADENLVIPAHEEIPDIDFEKGYVQRQLRTADLARELVGAQDQKVARYLA